MSVTQQLIYKVKELGIRLTEQNGQLIVKAPSNVWTAEIKQAVSKHKSEIIRLMTRDNVQTSSQQSISAEKPTGAYRAQRMLELSLAKEDVRSETDSIFALEIAKQKQADEYTLDDTLESLPFDHKFKLTEHVLTTFKKHLFGKRYKGEASNALFVECWFLANHDLTLKQLFEAAAEFVRLAKNVNDCGDSVELKRLREISEGVEVFRRFCLSNAEASH